LSSTAAAQEQRAKPRSGTKVSIEFAPSEHAPDDRFAAVVRPLITRQCARCHGETAPKAGVTLTAAHSDADVVKDYRVWRRVMSVVERGAMPPPKRRRQPSPAARTAMVGALRDVLAAGAARIDPGRPVLRRLNRRQLQRTMRDLLFGLPVVVDDRLPKDPQGYGFDTVGDVLFASPLLVEKYLDVAERALQSLAKRRDLLLRLAPTSPRSAAFTAATAASTLRPVLRRAFRRPPTEAEVASRVALVERLVGAGERYETALLAAVQSVLLAPQFLFRIETDRAASEPWPVRGFELATRLSYLLWSTMPDDALLDLAASGTLHQPAVLRTQVRRMLDDTRSRALADDFAAQWLGYREVLEHATDVRRFGKFNGRLRVDMYAESARFFDEMVRRDRPLTDLLDAPYAFLNQRLAAHYGIPGVRGEALREVRLPDRRRGGILGMGSMLATTSYPLRTSPVLRGKWILERLFHDPPPPPPADAGVLPPDDKPDGKATLREQLARHRREARCANCHDKMDPLGLVLEQYDAIGRWRDKSHGQGIDAHATLADGTRLDGPVALKDWLLTKKSAFLRTAAEKLLIYALGRDLALPDEKVVDAIVREVQAAGGSTRALIEAVATSYPFLHRRAAR
ncbi:MAG: DUF1592 domain-containing protein, partial [Planctomycetes bacterium]|nr:DUF1592 domain-containing protein [Planctomycetota bacterium]